MGVGVVVIERQPLDFLVHVLAQVVERGLRHLRGNFLLRVGEEGREPVYDDEAHQREAEVVEIDVLAHHLAGAVENNPVEDDVGGAP